MCHVGPGAVWLFVCTSQLIGWYNCPRDVEPYYTILCYQVMRVFTFEVDLVWMGTVARVGAEEPKLGAEAKSNRTVIVVTGSEQLVVSF